MVYEQDIFFKINYELPGHKRPKMKNLAPDPYVPDSLDINLVNEVK